MPCELDTQSWSNIYSMDATSDECLSEVRSLLSCPAQINVARSFRENEAQIFIDFLDQVLTRSYLDDKFRQRSLLLLSKICKARSIIPSSYILRRELIRIDRVYYYDGFADVCKGEYLGFPMAVKRLKMNKGDSGKIFKRLCREIVGWKHLSHPNILPLLGTSVLTDPDCFLILTEWMPSGNVMQYARSNPGANRLRLLSGAMSGVAYLHGLRIVHGDLKGANILVDNSDTARVADFGLMIMADLSAILLSETVVSTGGTLYWMSPELLDPPRFGSDGRLTRESDCYALGMVIYEVLTGFRPFHCMPGYTPVPAILRGERPERPFDAESLGFSGALWQLTQSCWSGSSSDRPTVQQLLDHLSLAALCWVPPPVYPARVVIDTGEITGSNSSGSSGMLLENPTYHQKTCHALFFSVFSAYSKLLSIICHTVALQGGRLSP